MAMQRSSSSSSTGKKNITQILKLQNKLVSNDQKNPLNSCDVFINHRSIDTKRNISGLLHDHFKMLGLKPFLDSKNMKPGDQILDKINIGIKQCKVGMAVFSPNYCKSYFCLHELSKMMEYNKRVLPVFCDVDPSQLSVEDDGKYYCQFMELEKFKRALEVAKSNFGISFDTSTGDWPMFLANVSEAVLKNLNEIEEEITMN